MASEETNLALSHHHQLLLQNTSNSSLRSNPPGSGPDRPAVGTTRELTAFIDHQHRFFKPQNANELRSSIYNSGPVHQNWNSGNGNDSGPCSGSMSADGSDGNDINDARPSSSENHVQELSQYPNALALVDRNGDLYYSSQYLHGTEGSGLGAKDPTVENSCGFSGRKDGSYSGEPGDSLRKILSDPITGTLMDDAMILPCGHSFGSGGLQHVLKMACYTCSRPTMESSVASNLSLRSAVLAFRREDELQGQHASKRRRERLDQDKSNYNDLMFMNTSRGRGLQSPLSQGDRVIIKGNKRIPERFVGCEAVVTAQCSNGWFVVKTLDNAESIKVQYRSLAKVSNNSSPHPSSSKMTPN
ncbi:U-box domain-containing protein 62-like isoform X2 [Rutidosis leptorrhynchoides]|uniref:U-box domain-containing protein 62-like isoform X2 n=1 Tax=Rutidosis leptorrhynchoides TaxID=125765 RepID=UPI003A99933F